MEFSDTLLLYLPSIPVLVLALWRKGKYTRGYSSLWTLLGIFCHYLKTKHKFKWLGLFLNPIYFLLGEGIHFNNWKTGLTYSFSCFLANIVFLRISGAIARLSWYDHLVYLFIYLREYWKHKYLFHIFHFKYSSCCIKIIFQLNSNSIVITYLCAFFSF